MTVKSQAQQTTNRSDIPRKEFVEVRPYMWKQLARRNPDLWPRFCKFWDMNSMDLLDFETILQKVRAKGWRPLGGRIRFPGSEMEDQVFRFQFTDDRSEHGKYFSSKREDENYGGKGKELMPAVRSALMLIFEMYIYRSEDRSKKRTPYWIVIKKRSKKKGGRRVSARPKSSTTQGAS